MAYVALYRKWRPLIFDDVVEQESVVSILKNTVKTGRIAHAYLFCGTRGTGKTTLAKIFARAINCLSPNDGNPCNTCDVCKGILSGQLLDVSEIDAASNNGVDNIRAIIDETNYAPSRAKFKVYIIDEVHMLSTGAFNALLKTLEEPPEGVVFILATTEPHKLPITILSRCQRYDFKRISRQGIIKRLEEICNNLSVQYDIQALNFISQKADGAMRDAISILDQTIAACSNNVTLKAARESAGSLDRMFVEQFTEKLLINDGASILKLSDNIFSEGRDPSNFITELMTLLRSILILQTIRDPGDMLYEDAEEIKRLKSLSSLSNSKEISYLIKELSRLENNLKWAVQRKIVFEAGMLNLCDRKTDANDDTSERITLLEQRIADLISQGIKYSSVNPSTKNVQVQENKQESAAIEKVNIKPEKQGAPLSLQPVDELDWNEFLQNVNAQKKSSMSALIRVNSKGYLMPPDEFCIVFNNKSMMDMVVKGDMLKILEMAASSATGRQVHVQVLMQSDINLGKVTSTQKKSESGEDDKFENALNILNHLSEKDGIEVNKIE